MRFVTVIDACPSDRVGAGDDAWHTLAILQAGSWTDINAFVANLKASLRTKGLPLRKWRGNANNEKRKARNTKYREGFLDALRASLPVSRVAFCTASCQERTLIAGEKSLCEQLGLEHTIVIADRPSICLGGYTKHWHDALDVVTLAAFEKVSPDGRSERIFNPLTVPQKNAIVWLWMGHALWSLYRNIQVQHQAKPAWEVHFDRLANDGVVNDHRGLGFIEMLLKAKTTVDLTSSYCEDTRKTVDACMPDLVVDCIAGWVNASVRDGVTTDTLEERLGEECRGHLGFHVVNDELGFLAMRSDFASQPVPNGVVESRH